MRGRPRKSGETTSVISARVPSWKKEIFELAGGSAEEAFNIGLEILLGNMISQGKINPEGVNLFIQNLRGKQAEIDERIAVAKKMLDMKSIQVSKGQLRVWDKVDEEDHIITSKQYDLNPDRYKIQEVIRT